MVAMRAVMGGAYVGSCRSAHKKVPGGAGFPPGTGADDSIDLFLPRGTTRIRKWIEEDCLT
jgi:hypothetical protein